MAVDSKIEGERSIELIAGRDPDGELVIEKVLVSSQPEANSYQLLKSPMFVQGIARADIIQALDKPTGEFKVLQHGGNLCIRVFGKQNLAVLEQSLTPALEKLGGDLDVGESRALVYSIHVSCGFNAIEKILNDTLNDSPDFVWYYGNVYDPGSGEPLNWWQAILSPD